MPNDSPTSARQVRILLVEDDRGHAALIRRVFASRAPDVELTTADTLEQARGSIALAAPDLLITDLLLPDGHGTELLADEAVGTAFPAMVMTGFGNEQAAADAIKAGALDYIVKSEATLSDMPHLADRALREWENTVERVRAAKRLRLLSSAVEQTSDGIAVTDLQGTLLFINDAFAQMHGYTPDELLGKHLSVFHSPDQMPAVEAANRQVLETGLFNGEIWRVRRDGATFPSIMSNSMLRDETGEPIGMIGTGSDVSELKHTQNELAKHKDHLEELVRERTDELEETNRQLQREMADRNLAEHELRVSEDRFRTLFETTPHGTVEIDTSGRITAFNRAYRKMLGYDRRELHGVSVAHIVPDETAGLVVSDIKTMAARQPEPSPYEIQHVTKDGRVIDCEVAWDYKRTSQGEVAGFVAVVTDVTERRKAERAVRKEQQLLRQLLDLQERERRLTAYEIHDGLAQQLAGAMLQFQGFRELGQRGADDNQNTFDRGLELLGNGLDEARRLISGLRPPILDESGILAAIDYLTEEHCGYDGPLIEFDHDVHFDRLPPPLETAVFRVVQESLTNACRHSRSNRIRVKLTELDGRVVIHVEDWGVGFDPTTVKQNHFGLQGIRERARLFGGRAVIDSAPGDGTRITVELPIVQKPLDENDSAEP